MKTLKRIAVRLLSLTAALLLLPMAASAAGEIDLNRPVALTIQYSYGEEALTGITFQIYLVSTADKTGELTPTDAFDDYREELDIRGRNDDAWAAIAQKLEREILSGSLSQLQPTDSAETDGSGAAVFPSGAESLTPGLYLVMGTRTEKDGYVYTTAPFMALLPEQDMENNVWNYAVKANSKPQQNPLTADFQVIKIWEDACHVSQRPASITVQLVCDGQLYGQPVTLPCDGKWEYTWHALDVNHDWTVKESPVECYKTPEIQRRGNTFRIINACNRAGASDEQENLPQTGQPWWPVPVLAAAGLLLIVLGLIRRKGAGNEEK